MDEHGKLTVRRLALWGIPLSFGVMGLKMLAWWVMGSVALLSDGLESTVNVVAAFIAFFVIRYAQKPADETHQFGHHKAEYMSAVVEGVLIVVAALLIVREAIGALGNPQVLDAPVLGLAINVAATVINAVWAAILIRAGRKYRSPALTADGHHINSDVITSVGVLVGLVLVVATGYAILDPILAILVSLNILYQGWKVISRSIAGLMDQAVDPDEEAAIKKAIATNAEGSLGVHDLKTRSAGAATFVDFHLVVPAAMAVGDAHAICDRLEDAIRAAHPGARIAIHVEPESEKAHGVRVKVKEKSK
ncbi:cation diffusion facilitator family transporter [Rhizobiaceae bacterium n13]|uniref:cation diffusion facilitator family transporter n=1 Tax=Ferirhizobium litorale TaxID=2927786 RepID=UPI0024B2F5F2|nr:cation diffusion facilitator family transporter [Fererhizobium litorale]MDI7860837.1 cation diffusion facilitator family transporter [Fererhizobium litorale]